MRTAPLARPRASIVVATHARPEFLLPCVASIVAATRDGDEIIVAETRDREAADLLADVPGSVRRLSSLHPGKTSKLNAAIRAAQGEVILVTDDDCRVAPGWVDAMTRPFGNPVVGVAFGPVVGLSSVRGDGQLPVIPAGPAPPELWNFAHGASMAVRKTAAMDVGGFDERFGPGTGGRGGEEHDLVLRLGERGWACEVAAAPSVEHLEWRDQEQTSRNLLVYQRGSGMCLGAALRRDPARTVKPFVLRLLHEKGLWRDRRARGWRFGPRMTVAFAAGLLRGVAVAPRRFLDAPRADVRTGDRPRVLWVTDEPPDRHQGGGNIRQAMLLGAIHGRFDVTLLLAGHLRDDGVRRRLCAVLEVPRPRERPRASLARRRARDLWRALARRRPSDVVAAARLRRRLRPVLDRVADDFDVVVVQHLYLAGLLPARRGASWLLHLFDVSSERTRQELAGEHGRRQRWLLSRDAAKAARYEHERIASYDGVVVVSERDAATLAPAPGHRAPRVFIVPNGVDLTALTPTPLPAAPNLLFPGTLSYRPNVLGALWFCGEVLPLVRKKLPEARLALVGRDPVPEITALTGQPGVEVHADVPQMAPWFRWGRVVVVPLRMGTGTRLKVLEAMATARPVVGTSIGLEGLGAVDGEHARIADEPAAMAEAIVGLLARDAEAEAVARNGRRLVEEHFGWDAAGGRLAEALTTVLARSLPLPGRPTTPPDPDAAQHAAR